MGFRPASAMASTERARSSALLYRGRGAEDIARVAHSRLRQHPHRCRGVVRKCAQGTRTTKPKHACSSPHGPKARGEFRHRHGALAAAAAAVVVVAAAAAVPTLAAPWAAVAVAL